MNTVTKETYEKISQVKDSFEKAMQGISLIREAKLPLKIKTQITKDNLKEIPKLKKIIENCGLKFRSSYDLYARLNGDLSPCNLRISPEEALRLCGKKQVADDDCQIYKRAEVESKNPEADNLFRCVAGGGDGIQVDPYGNLFTCSLIRKPAFNLLQVDFGYARNRLSQLIRNKKFDTDSKCKGCNLREDCHWCPGRALVEKGDMEAPIEYYCELARQSQ